MKQIRENGPIRKRIFLSRILSSIIGDRICKKLSIKGILLGVAVSFGMFSSAHSQEDSPFWGGGIQTPTAASLTAAAELSLNKHAGSPDFYIPLYTVEIGDLSLPLGLRYIGDGLMVDNIPSWVGMGWSLLAGGAVTRSVRGLPDDDTYGFINTGNRLYDTWFTESTTLDSTNYYNEYKKNWVDPEPDVFHFNVGNFSGKFVFGPNGEAMELSGQNIQIDYIYEVISSGITKWVITDADGTKYTFAAYERIESASKWFSSGASGENISIYKNAWYVKKIESPSGSEIIFEYSSSDSLSSVLYIDIQRRPYCESVQGPDYYKTRENQMTDREYPLYLTRITTREETLEFSVSTREDIPDAFGEVNKLHKLDTITLKRRGSIFKSFKFDYEYKLGSSSGSKRLILKKLTPRGTSSTQTLPSYEFDYIPGELPERLSESIDHWGYFRGGATTASTSGCDWVKGFEPPGASTGRDRTPFNFSLASIGLLREIKYPTGGKKTIMYEPNEHLGDPAKAGGGRIAEIISEDGLGNTTTHRYDYGAGVVVTTPTYSNSYGGYTFWTTGLFQQIGYSGGSHVGYKSVDEVIESGGNTGYVRHEYTTAETFPDEITYPEIMGKVTSNAHRRGVLLRTAIYKTNNVLVREENHGYGYETINYSYKDDDGNIYNDNKLQAMAIRFTMAPDWEWGHIEAFWGFYAHKLRWRKKEKTTINILGNNNTTMTQVINYMYDNILRQLRSVKEINSNDNSRTTEYKYAHEISDDGRGFDYTPMDSVNMLRQPYSVTVTDSAGNVKSKDWILWRYDDNNDRWLRDSEWLWTGGDPKVPVFKINN